MALVINDRVKETTTTTGTGTVSLAGAVTGFETFAAGVGNSNTTYYAIVHQTANEFEVGLGTLDGDSSDLARTTVISSSNSDSAVDFAAGTKDVFCTIPASKLIFEDANNDATVGRNLTVTGDLTVSGDDITMGTNTNTAIMVADGTNFNPVVPSGDVSLTNAGVFGIASGVIVNADVNASAAIAMSKTAFVAGTGVSLSTNTLSVDAAQTGITSILATDVSIGEDDETIVTLQYGVTPTTVNEAVEGFYLNSPTNINELDIVIIHIEDTNSVPGYYIYDGSWSFLSGLQWVTIDFLNNSVSSSPNTCRPWYYGATQGEALSYYRSCKQSQGYTSIGSLSQSSVDATNTLFEVISS